MASTGAISRLERSAAAILAGVGVFALVGQWLLLIDASGHSHGTIEATLRFFSFFTIQSNILVVLVLIGFALRGHDWVIHPFVRSAVATYIAVVFLIYVMILRSLWSPQGMQWVVDALLHYAMPVAYLGFWALAVRKRGLRWSDPLLWLVYPLFYLAVILIRGHASGFYPYPFIDVAALGYRTVAVNAAGILALFVLVGLVIVTAARRLERRETG